MTKGVYVQAKLKSALSIFAFYFCLTTLFAKKGVLLLKRTETMTGTLQPDSEIIELELKLAEQEDEQQRLVIIDKLAKHYSFTDIRKTQTLLSEQEEILENIDQPDFQLNFYLNTAFIENQLYNFQLSEQHYKSAIDLIEERGDANQQAETYIDYAGTCMNLHRMDAAVDYLKKAEKLLKTFPDERLAARIICREGFLNLHNSNISKAIELFLEADKQISSLEKSLELKDKYFHALIHSGLGKVYEQNGEKKKSIKSFQKVVNMCEEMGMKTRLSWHYLNVGNGFMSINDQASAEYYFRKAIGVSDDISQHTRASAYANLGFCYFQNEKYRQALELYTIAEQLYKEKKEDDYSNFAIIERWKAYLYDKLGRKKKALNHFFNALANAKKTTDFNQLSGILKDIAGFYAKLGDFKNAYDYQILYDKAALKSIEQINSRKIMELEVKYEAEKREQEAELLRLQATKLQLKALRAQMNPHFMYNALNSIQNFITSNEVEFAEKYLAKFSMLMRQSLEYSEKEIISLEKEIEFLEDYLIINEKLRFEDRMKYEIFVDDEIEEDILGVPTMIVQPYLENAIEHGVRNIKDGLIRLSFSLFDENTILCVVEDNGVGREKAKEMKEKDPQFANHKSRGTIITESRLEILHKTKEEKNVWVKTIDLMNEETGEPKGTRVEIKIPIVEIQVK